MSWRGSKTACGCCGLGYKVRRIPVCDRQTKEQTAVFLCERCQSSPERTIWRRYGKT